MLSKQHHLLLQKFADLNDQLFELEVTTTDSFTGELGEYVACKHFKLSKSARVTKAVDGVCSLGKRYQVKANIVSDNDFSVRLNDLPTGEFDYLIVVFFDMHYNPLKLLKISSRKIKDGKFVTSTVNLKSHGEVFDKKEIKISAAVRIAIKEFAATYNALREEGIIRSRRIVGDIGESYACKKLGLQLCDNQNQKGIDATHKNGSTFEIKTRRVYESGRRTGVARRLNNLSGKSADWLIVVVLDREFKCAGMWLLPMQNISNSKSAHLTVVNSTPGTLTVIPSQISWLQSGQSFVSFNALKPKSTIKRKSNVTGTLSKGKIQKQLPRGNVSPTKTASYQDEYRIDEFESQNDLSNNMFHEFKLLLWILIIIACAFYLFARND